MRSDFLFAMPSVWSGAARLGSLFGQYDVYNDSPTDEMADARALYGDWRVTGQDLAEAMKRFDREPKTARQGTRRDTPR